MRHLGEDVDLHEPDQVTRRPRSPGDDDPARVEIEFENARLEQEQGVKHERVVRRPVLDVGDDAERAAALLLDGEPDELEDVVGVRVERGELVAADRQRGAARHRAIQLHDRPPRPVSRR